MSRRADIPTLHLTAPALRRALAAGAHRVIASRGLLNRINVFPVADGDTGNNLAFTLTGLLNGALSRRSRHVGELLGRVGDEAIDGARGNSGAILAQFLYGLAEHAKALPSMDAQALAAAVRHGASSARAALAQPVEGTILTVIGAFAQALEDAGTQQSSNDLRETFARALVRARVALAETPRQMALLQKAGVVDAGAQGFVDLLEGVADYVAGGARLLRMRSHAPAAANELLENFAHEHVVDPARRWCTECLVLGDALDRDSLRDALAAIDADSMVIAGGATRLRVHAHVGRPQRLFDACAAQGDVDAMKADDMLLQQRSTMFPHRVAILTDSAADLPDAIAERYAVTVVPVRVNLDQRDYLDKIGLATDEFYRRMAVSTELPRTSQPPPGDFRRAFDFVLAHHPAAIYVGLSRAVSGTLQSAEHAAARCNPQRLHVFDTFNAAGGQGLLAWRAAELADAGAQTDAILAELQRLRPQTLTWAMARDITHAVRGGRIPAWAAPAVRCSGLTPIAKVRDTGTLAIAGGLFAKRRAPEAFAAYVARRLPQPMRWRAIVGHCDAREDGERLLVALKTRIDITEAHLVETGPAIGAHAGRGALVTSLQPAPQIEPVRG
ncbi:MAG: DegV family EDD domain-containing protein [Lysobacter sp.]|nr:DegV family EDD domain-containing protein [Lysobacter sp.]